MNSFYGGKQGSSFIIAQTYTTIAEMVANFGKNNSACPVNFDEYALINTVNKNNPENGQVFRRGYDYNSGRKIISYKHTYGKENPYEEIEIEANGAVYIGTIVGPAGRAPIFNFGQYEDVQNTTIVHTKYFSDIGITYPSESGRSTVVSKLNSLTTIDAETGVVSFFDDIITDFYSLELIKDDSRSMVQYYCYDNKYRLNNQNSAGWYAVDSVPGTGVDTFDPSQGLIPGVSYAYENGELLYDIDINTGKRSMRKGVNRLGNTYQDTIDWAYCTVRNENLEDSTAYIGFRFGSPVVEFETESVSPYFNRSDIIDTATGLPNTEANKTHKFENLNLITRDQKQADIEAHPFYSKWKISIPKGIKGDAIKNIYLVDAAKEHKIEQFVLDKDGNLLYNEITGEVQVIPYVEDVSTPEGMSAVDIESSKEKWVIVCDYVCYDRMAEGELHTIYLGDFNQLDGITLEHFGQLVFNYSHDNTERTPQQDWIHWIDKMKFNDNGTITITFNDSSWDVAAAANQDVIEKGVLTKEKLINWITNMEFSNNGTVDVMFNNDNLFNGQLTKEKLINWITDVEFLENGTVNITFNNDNLFNGKLTKEQLITWVTDFSLNEDDGTLIVNFNNNRLVPNINKTLQWVKDISISPQGTVTTDYTNKADRVQENYLSWINDMSFDEEGTVVVTFNHDKVNTDQVKNGVLTKTHLLHWINDMNFADDGTLTVDFNNEDLNPEGSQIKNGKINLPQLITWMTKFDLDEDTGRLQVDYNNNKLIPNVDKTLQWVKDITIADNGTVTTDYTNQDDKVQTGLIQWINDVKVNDDGAGNGNQKVSIKYNNANDYVDIGSPLNYVMRMGVDPSNGNLLALYSDPQKRQSGISYDNVSGWSLLGNLKYSKTMAKSDYDAKQPAERVSDLITGAICYSIEEI